MASLEELLLNGYIREAEIILIDKIIPEIINVICLNFYGIHDIIFLFTSNDLYMIHRKAFQKYNIISSKVSTNILTQSQQSGICCIQNWCLPHHITLKLFNDFNDNLLDHNAFKLKTITKFNSVIFKVGGAIYSSTKDKMIASNICNTIIINGNVHNKSRSAYNIPLPPYPQGGICGNSLVFSEQYGLISIGGMTSHSSNYVNTVKTRRFSFDDWEWKEMKHSAGCGKHAAVTMINKDKILITNGCNSYGRDVPTFPCKYGQINTAKIYDIKKCIMYYNKPRNCNHSRCGAGIHHNKNSNKIYVGGGCFQGKYVKYMEYYDIDKNKWYKLSKTTFKHGNKPIIWMTNNDKMLYIASTTEKVVEALDLRMKYNSFSVQHELVDTSLQSLICNQSQLVTIQ